MTEPDKLPPAPWTAEATVMSDCFCVLAANDEVVARCSTEEVADAIAGIPDREMECHIMINNERNLKADIGRLRAEIDDARAAELEKWHELPPTGVWLRTARKGEDGENVCMLTIDGSEWIEKDTGRTTITHHSFAPPTHWAARMQHVSHRASNEIAQLNGEIDRLRAELAELAAKNMQHHTGNTALRAENDELRKLIPPVDVRVALDTLRAENERLQGEEEESDRQIHGLLTRVAELEEALVKYGQHRSYCNVLDMWSNKICNCGLTEVRAELAKAKEEMSLVLNWRAARAKGLPMKEPLLETDWGTFAGGTTYV